MRGVRGAELVPTVANRVANALLGALLAAGCAAYAAEADGARVWAAVGLGAGGVVLAVRGYRAGVRCEAERLVVRGFLRTRVVPRAAVTGVTGLPAVRWVSARGRSRWTPVTAFAVVSGETGAARARKRQSTTRLRRWAAGGRAG